MGRMSSTTSNSAMLGVRKRSIVPSSLSDSMSLKEGKRRGQGREGRIEHMIGKDINKENEKKRKSSAKKRENENRNWREEGGGEEGEGEKRKKPERSKSEKSKWLNITDEIARIGWGASYCSE